ncbi:MAG: endonuclease [Bacteroidales bacterium]|nr:endonuclease [Bacteroidales bacterium]
MPTTLRSFSALLLLSLLTSVLFAQIPPNYYNSAQGLTGASLKTALHNIIDDHTEKSYDYLWTAFQTTDDKSNGKVWDMYSDLPGNPPYEYTFSADQCSEATAPYENYCYNREHSWPRSWYGGAEDVPMYTDLFHVYPTDAWVNEQRSNFPYGQVNSPSTTTQNGSKLGSCSYPGYSGTVFEPIDAYKGDFARTYFYMVTRYEDLVATWYSNSSEANAVLQPNTFPVFETWFLNMLIAWHNADPVSAKEIDRNNAVFAIQGNRNPFIDHPEYVQCVWATCLEDEPANHATDFSAHTITLNWADATGATLPDGYLVRMSNQGFDNILAPDDGIPVTDNFWNKNVPYGKQTATFGGLTPNTVYYFKIFGYRGAGATIGYKTDGAIQQVSIEAK